ncbi:hypothetical protein D3Z38_17340 [Clostridiales bacterium]|nr:hypothetical protein [Clostridiales bacterium]
MNRLTFKGILKSMDDLPKTDISPNVVKVENPNSFFALISGAFLFLMLIIILKGFIVSTGCCVRRKRIYI